MQVQPTPLVDYTKLDNVADKRIFRKAPTATRRRIKLSPEISNVASNIPKQKPKVTIQSEKRIKEANRSGLKPRSTFYAYVQSYTQEAIEMMVYLMRTSRNEGIRLGAARSILDKSIPDLKALEISGELRQQYTLQLQQYAPTDPLQRFNEQNPIEGELREIEATSSELQATMSHNVGSATLSSLDNSDNSTISPNTQENSNSTQIDSVEG